MAKLRERYAQALFELSDENNHLEKHLNQALLVRDALKEEDVQDFLVHPHISKSKKKALFNDVFSQSIDPLLMDFLFLLIDKNRAALIVPSLSEYIKRVNRHFNKTEATVVSAKKLTEKQAEAIRTILMNKTNMDIVLREKVDPDVIGGFYILIDGFVFDRTVRSQLHTITEKLKREGGANVS